MQTQNRDFTEEEGARDAKRRSYWRSYGIVNRDKIPETRVHGLTKGILTTILRGIIISTISVGTLPGIGRRLDAHSDNWLMPEVYALFRPRIG